MAASPLSLAEEVETRDFAVMVDNKNAGAYRMTISRQEDGTVTMAAHAEVKLSYLVYTYKYCFQGSEVWKDGQLQQLKSITNDDGKKFNVTANLLGSDLRLTVNGNERWTRPDVWTTTYWQLAPPKFRGEQVPLLDADCGNEITGTLSYVGSDVLNLLGRAQNCAHYKLTGGRLQVQLWYDAQQRMVRQESIEDGHKTILELAHLER
jgi:hypothetical protein